MQQPQPSAPAAATDRVPGGNLTWIPPTERRLSGVPPSFAPGPAGPGSDPRGVRTEGFALLAELAADD